MRVTLRGLVKQYVEIKPGNRITLKGFGGDKMEKELTITSYEEEPLEITDLSCTIDDMIKYKLETLEKGKQYKLVVENRLEDLGSYNGQLILKTTSKKKPHLVISVYGKLRKEVSAKPEKLLFGTLNPISEKFNPKKLEQKVVLHDVRGDGFSIKKIKASSKWIKTEIEKGKTEKKRYTIRVILNKDKLPEGKIDETISVFTSYAKKPLVIPLKGQVL